MMQLSHWVVCSLSSSWMPQRVAATDCAKQQHTSIARQNSGAFCSPQRPLQGHVPLQQMYLRTRHDNSTVT